MPDAKPTRPYIVRNSHIHGRGVFAARKIKKGTRIIEYKGERVSWDEALKRPDTDPDNPFHTFFFELDDGRVIDAGVRGNAARWINHSCSPNCKTEEDDDDRVHIFARSRSSPATSSPTTTSCRSTASCPRRRSAYFECRCGKKKCRGTMLEVKKKKKKKKEKAK